MSLDYIIALDFETTFPTKSKTNNGWYHEIIEFGAVLIDVEHSYIEDEFQSYVRPTEFPNLTRRCINKLNITQTDVDNAPPLQQVLSKFYKWINGIQNQYDLVMPGRVRSHNENAYFCTWSSMDLGFFLRNECGADKKNISYANYLKYWIDGQDYYYTACGRKAPGKLYEAANYLNTPVIGNAHGALDDAKTLAVLICDIRDNSSVDWKLKDCN